MTDEPGFAPETHSTVEQVADDAYAEYVAKRRKQQIEAEKEIHMATVTLDVGDMAAVHELIVSVIKSAPEGSIPNAQIIRWNSIIRSMESSIRTALTDTA